MIHDFGDFFGMHPSQRTTGYGKVLGINTYGITIYGSGACNYTIPGQVFITHIKILACMFNKQVVFMKRFGVNQGNDALAGSHLSRRFLLINGYLPTPHQCITHTFLEVSCLSG